MKVVWGDRARRHFREIVAYIRRRNPVAAKRVSARIKNASRGLAHMPEKFRVGAEPGTREHVVPGLPYILVYQIDADRVLVRALFHAAQDKPRGG